MGLADRFGEKLRPDFPLASAAHLPDLVIQSSQIGLPSQGRALPHEDDKQLKISEMNWFAVETYLKSDDRAIVPLGSTEQHAYLSNAVDSILSEKVAVDAAEPLGVPVFPVLAYGITPYFATYPGSVSLRMATYARIIVDMLDSLATTGFRRILFVNGHGGNSPGQTAALEWLNGHADCRIRWHNWWSAPQTMSKVQAIDPVASTPRGWRILRGRDYPISACQARKSRWPISTSSKPSIPRALKPCWATAILAGTTNAQTKKWTPSGMLRWPRRGH